MTTRNLIFGLGLALALPAAGQEFELPSDASQKLHHLEILERQNEVVATSAAIRLVRSSQTVNMAVLNAEIKEVLGHPEWCGRDGIPNRNLGEAAEAQVRQALESHGVRLSPKDSRLYCQALIQEARLAGASWKEKNIADCPRINKTPTAHGFMAEGVAWDNLAKFPGEDVRYAKPSSKSTDIVRIREGRMIEGIQVKVENHARGSFRKSLYDAFTSAAANPYKASQGMTLLIPRDQYQELVSKGVLETEGRVVNTERYAEFCKRAYVGAVERGGVQKSAQTNDGRLARLEDVHGRPVSKVALDAVKNARFSPLPFAYSELRQHPLELKQITESIRVSHPTRIGTGVSSGLGLGLNLYFLWEQRGEIHDAFTENPKTTHDWMVVGKTGTMTASFGAFAVADTASLATSLGASGFRSISEAAGPIGWVLLGGYEAFQIADYANGGVTSREFYTGQAALVGGVGGGIAAGASAGALVGLAGGPFAEVTVPVGAFIGGVAGAFGGAKLGESLASAYYEQLDEKQQARVDAYILEHYRNK